MCFSLLCDTTPILFCFIFAPYLAVNVQLHGIFFEMFLLLYLVCCFFFFSSKHICWPCPMFVSPSFSEEAVPVSEFGFVVLLSHIIQI